MTVALQAIPQFFDNAGVPLSGGKIFSYEAGTLIPLPTYTDRGGTTPNANPVILDAAGRADIWLTANVAYKLIVQDSDGTVMDSVDQFYAGADPSQLVAAGIVPATGGAYTGPVAFQGGATFDGTPAQDLATLDSLGIAAVRNTNLWINSDFSINQRGASSVADGAYGFDRTVALCETGSITLSQLAQPTDGIPYAMRITQPDAAPKRVGSLQIVEAENCLAYRGKNLVFAPKVRCSAATTVRVALVAWTGSLDAPTRDVVNGWSSTAYTAGNFFVANTLTIATGAAAVAAGEWSDVVVSSSSAGGVVAPSTLNNLYLVVWTEAVVAQNVTLDLSVMRAGQGTSLQLWTPPDTQQELARCQRYFQPFNYFGGTTSRTNVLDFTVPTGVQMRATPTVTNFASGGGSASAAIYNGTAWFQAPVAANNATATGLVGPSVLLSYAYSGATAGWPGSIAIAGTLSAEL